MMLQSNTARYLFITALLLITKLGFSGLLPIEQDTIRVFTQISPYVINVHQTSHTIDKFWNKKKIITGTGSGIILNPHGLMVTNYHVLGGNKTMAITLKNGKTLKATFIGGDPRKDVAVLKISNSGAVKKLIHNKPLAIANSKKLHVGQIAIAIGNPFGLDETLTSGFVSALDREIFGYGGVQISGMIQTDASINPGNSGGPLLDSQGHLIGMNTMIYSSNGGFSGIGFAIPSNTIHRITTQILKHGKVITPGIGIVPLPDQIAFQSGIRGVVIYKVVPNLPASQAGLKGMSRNRRGEYHVGDIITAINGKPVRSFNDLYQVLDKQKLGTAVTLTIMRDKKRKTVKITTTNVG